MPIRKPRCASCWRSPTRSKPVQDGRIYIELINGPMLYEFRAAPAEYKAGLDLAIDARLLWLHESGTYVKFTQAGADLFA